MEDIFTPEEEAALRESAIAKEPISSGDEGEETPKEPQMSDEDKKKIEAFPRIYKRMKDTEEELKKFKTPKPQTELISDMDKILEIQRATKDLDPEEISELRLRSKASGISLEEAKKDENYNLWLNAKRERSRKEKQIPEPTSFGSSLGVETKEIKKGMTQEERDEIMQKRIEDIKQTGREY